MANIAVVSSTEFGGSNRDSFLAGLTSSLGGKPQPTILKPFESRGNYNSIELCKLVRSAVNNNPKPDLIISVGGLEMAQAAASELQDEQDPKFIFLSNDALEGNPVGLAGGVNLNAPCVDDARKRLLNTIGGSVEELSTYLIVNNNSPMWRNDAKNWPLNRVARFFEGAPNPLQKASENFIAEFDKLARRN